MYRGRRSASIENGQIRVTVLREGGHIAEILHKQSGINPLWTPPWESMEPTAFNPHSHAYGAPAEARLLAGIMGHNLCLDVFGGPSDEEFAAGIGVHGEGSVVPYEIETAGESLRMSATLPLAGLRFERTIELDDERVGIREIVENLAATDRPIAWTQHVSLGPPFLQKGSTQFRISATLSKVYEDPFGADDYLRAGAEFDWPLAPLSGGGEIDQQLLAARTPSSAFTAHLMDPGREGAFFTAHSPQHNLTFGYHWKRADFPWLGMWEENFSRQQPPWNGQTLARGMEFGASPIPETRRQMIDRGTLFGVPTYRWLPAKGRLDAAYQAGFSTTPAT